MIPNEAVQVKFNVETSGHQDLGLLYPEGLTLTKSSNVIPSSPMLFDFFHPPKLQTMGIPTVDLSKMFRNTMVFLSFLMLFKCSRTITSSGLEVCPTYWSLHGHANTQTTPSDEHVMNYFILWILPVAVARNSLCFFILLPFVNLTCQTPTTQIKAS